MPGIHGALLRHRCNSWISPGAKIILTTRSINDIVVVENFQKLVAALGFLFSMNAIAVSSGSQDRDIKSREECSAHSQAGMRDCLAKRHQTARMIYDKQGITQSASCRSGMRMPNMLAEPRPNWMHPIRISRNTVMHTANSGHP